MRVQMDFVSKLAFFRVNSGLKALSSGRRRKIAVIGAGFAGLSAAWHLCKEHHVVVFDAKGVGGGASGISAGLLHPYPGEKGRTSWKAGEAMAIARQLLKVSETALNCPVAHYGGILKCGPCLSPGDDVEKLGEEEYLIRSGITVFVSLYLKGLWKACEQQGSELQIQKIGDLKELKGFDVTILCVGAGISHFVESRRLRLNFVKGQILTCLLEKTLKRSVVAKHYTAMTENRNLCYVGATYERDFASEEADLKTAIALLQPKLPVVGCCAGIRVTNRAHYFPILEKIDKKTWVITALGSRGLLYHGYMGKLLTEALSSSIV